MSSIADRAQKYVEVTEELTGEGILVQQDERRRFARRPARWNTVVTTRKKEVLHCKTRDVSERGTSICSPYDFNMHATIRVDIEVYYKGMKKSLSALGEVRHSAVAADGFIIGIYFKDATETTIRFLRSYANSRI